MIKPNMSKYIAGIDPCDEEPKTNLDRVPFSQLIKEYIEYYEKAPLVEELKQEGTLEEVAENNDERADAIGQVLDQFKNKIEQ